MTIEHRFARKLAVLAASGALLLAPGTAAAVAAPAAVPAAPGSNGAAPGADGTAAKADDRSDPVADERRELNRLAVEKVVRGEAPVQQRGGSKSVQVAPGQWAEYGL